MLSTSALIILLTACAAAGLALVGAGLRGRRINDHPVCRRCDFDLVGLDRAGAGVEKCPECGAGLERRRAVRIGRRRRRRGAIALGSILLLAAAAGAGALGWGRTTAFNWNTIKPAWMLESEARAGDPGVERAALAELARRAAGDELTSARLTRLAAFALDVQASSARPWLPEWGDIVGHAWRANLLTSEQHLAYVGRLVDVALSVRPRVRSGDNLSVSLKLMPGKAGSALLRLEVCTVVDEVRVGDLAVRRSFAASCTPVGGGMGTVSSGCEIRLGVDPGEYVVVAPVGFSVRPGGTPGVMIGGRTLNTAPPLVGWTENRSAPLVVVAADEMDVVATRNEQLRESFERGASVERAEASVVDGSPEVVLQVRIGEAPMPYAFTAFARVGDREWPLGAFAGSGRDVSHGLFAADMAGFESDTIDVILRPDVAAARRSTTVFEIWDGELVIRDVPVTWLRDEKSLDEAPQDAAPRPGPP